MAHLAGESLLGQTAREVADAKEADHPDDTQENLGNAP